ncbi:phosphoribosyl-ATP diphosphatase [Lichenibacterium dinghuense]|uniref:phosphoribosyl-ATP diphosphatase n=1 Tax=Lichenibacterium dinghuense TaxID=2895977 RepID=UPI001F028FE7|nr:phosphoribosyl-ATP diphosphatase [Lichenibacterium sp. 6Y81]
MSITTTSTGGGDRLFTLGELERLIAERGHAMADKSYTRSLLDAGVPRIAKKFGEEAVEAVIAAVEKDKPALLSEAADVIYHLLVLLHASNLSLDQVVGELGRRTRQSGHEEKASRPQQT